MTTKNRNKSPKVRKLRNAEYYNFQKVQDKLYQQSKNNKIFTKLIDIITMEENILLAYRNIKKNKGSHTAGTDKKTIDDIANWGAENLIKHIRKKLDWYQPKSVRRVEIPKANGKVRALGIPTIIDRIIQQCILQVLEPICEAKFFERNNGFRPCRSTEHAMAQTYMYAQISHLYFVVDIDIKGFFDNVNHAKLIKQMWTLGIRDKKLLSIISVMLKAEIAKVGFPEKGTPQGGIISPLLANIVLNELDWWIASQWENIPTKFNYKPAKERGYATNKFRAIRNTNLKECYIVRYADDFKIFCRTKKDAENIFIATKKWLKERLSLDISEEKSKVIDLRKQYSEYLGFKIKLMPKGKMYNNTTKYVIKSKLSEKARKKIIQEGKDYIKQIQHSEPTKQKQRISQYNAYVMGIHNYYSMATTIANDLKEIAFVVDKNARIRLSELSKVKPKNLVLNKAIKKYAKSKAIRYYNNQPILPLSYAKYKSPMFKKVNINRYTPEGREEIHRELETVNPYMLIYLSKNYIPNRTIEYNDNRISTYVAQQGKCKVTETALEIGNMHCHHIIPKKNGGTDEYENLIFVTKDIHKLIHITDKNLIMEYLNKLKLNTKQLNKVNLLREKAKTSRIYLESCVRND